MRRTRGGCWTDEESSDLYMNTAGLRCPVGGFPQKGAGVVVTVAVAAVVGRKESLSRELEGDR